MSGEKSKGEVTAFMYAWKIASDLASYFSSDHLSLNFSSIDSWRANQSSKFSFVVEALMTCEAGGRMRERPRWPHPGE